MEELTVCDGSVAISWIGGQMERSPVCKGSVVLIWIRKHHICTIQKGSDSKSLIRTFYFRFACQKS